MAWFRPNDATYINNSTQSSDSVRSEDSVCATACVFHDRASDHDNVLCGVCQLLDDKVHHLPQAGIFVLEELRDTEEKGRSFIGREFLSRVEEESNLGK